jgi:hypothetical protein
MGDTLQVIIVTAAAAAALVTLVKPYLRRPETKPGAPPCANCGASMSSRNAREPVLPVRSAHK